MLGLGVLGTLALCAVVGAVVASLRERDLLTGALLGFFLGPLGWLILLLLPDRRLLCPECRGPTQPEARRCRHCGVTFNDAPARGYRARSKYQPPRRGHQSTPDDNPFA